MYVAGAFLQSAVAVVVNTAIFVRILFQLTAANLFREYNSAGA